MKKRLILLVMIFCAIPWIAWAAQETEDVVTILCPWGVGSAEDGALFVLRPLLEQALNAPVSVQTEAGQGGAQGVEYAVQMPADGNHFFIGNQSMILLDIKAELGHPYRNSMTPLVRLTNMTYILAVSQKMATSAFQNYNELVSYAHRNPGEIICGVLSVSGVDGLALEQLFPQGDVVPKQFDSGKQVMEDLILDQIQLCICGVGEIIGLIDRGDLIPLMVLDSQRLKAMPDVPCAAEYGLEMKASTWIGIWAPAGSDAEKTERFAAAVQEAMKCEEWKRYLIWSSNDQHGGFMNQTQFERFIENEYGRYTALYTRLGRLKRFYGEMD